MSGQRRYFHGGDQGNRKRRRVSSETPEIEDRLESLIVRVGEKSTSSLESNLEGLASVLEADLPSFKHKILRIMADCAVRMPEKCSIYSTLVGLINVKNYNFGGEFVELMVRNFKEALKTCHWDEARYGVRFLSDLVNCHVVSASSLMQLYHNLLEVIWEEGVPTVRKDWYSYVVLSSLPWVGRELYEKKEPELDKLLTNIGKYVDQRDKLSMDALRVWSVDEPHPQEEYLDCLWAQIQKMKTDLWQEKHIARPYLSFDSVLCEALQHNLPPVLPPPHQPEYQYPLPWVVFRLFDYTDCPEGPILPGAHSIERYLIEEQLHNVIEQFHMERKECAARLLSYPNRQQIPLDYMIVEVMLSELFGLPSNRYLDICYGSIMIELCKLQPSTMPQVLAQATELLYERLANMNTCCFERFVGWFSYHLSNFQFRWSWEDWSDCLQLETEHPKQKFVREVLYKALRLSYYQCIVEIVPENFHDLVPPSPVPSFKYKFDSEEDLAANPGAETVKQMVNLIRSKCTPEQLLAMLKEVPNPEGPEGPCNPLAIDYLVQTLLFMGSKSFSHSFAALAKFHSVFKALLETEEAQICCLKSLHSFWGQNIQVSVLIDKMLKTSIIHCSAVATWLFSKDMQEEFTKHYVWEILHLTIRKMNRHVTKLETEVGEAREKIQHVDSESSESDSDMMSSKRRRVDPPEKVTAEMIEKMEEQLELAQADQKNLYLIIFQRFIMLLTEHIVRCDTDGRDFNTHWYHWISGRLNQVFMLHMDQVWKYKDTLETLLFTHDLDPHILKLFQQFCALKV